MKEISVGRGVDEFACVECVIQKDYLLKSPYYFYFIRVFELCVWVMLQRSIAFTGIHIEGRKKTRHMLTLR